MSSQFSWVDFAEEDRQQMLNVVQLFREQETRDELGLGVIRDAFADYFFPGTSTIQTRVRYMLFIPWIYRELERKQVGPDKIARRARDTEIKLIDALLETEGKNHGVIGQDARSNLKRLPSSVYWAGLGAWGIRLFAGSQDQYHRYLGAYYTRRRQQQAAPEESDPELFDGPTSENWDPGLPASPADFSNACSFTLTPAEARYLRERIYLRHPGSLLAHLVTASAWVTAGIFWEHPVVGQIPEELRKTAQHAQYFSETMHGAALIYNLLLARKINQADLVNQYETWVGEWAGAIEAKQAALSAWQRNLSVFWQSPPLELAHISLPTRNFVETWLEALFQVNQPAQLANQSNIEVLLTRREVQLKRNRARLQNPRALERWTGASGSRPLEYRWSTAAGFVQDILAGLVPQETANA